MLTMDRLQWTKIKSCPTQCDSKQFWKAVQIWIEKPHVVNRRLSVAVPLGTGLESLDSVNALFNKFLECGVKSFDNPSKIQTFLTSHLCLKNEPSTLLFDETFKHETKLKVWVRKLIPKVVNHQKITDSREDNTIIEIVLLDRVHCQATFIPLVADLHFTRCAYKFSLLEEPKTSILLSLPDDYLEPSSPSAAVTRPTKSWLSDTLLTKLARWATEVDPDVPLSSSHALISVERYSTLYAELKQKYGPKFVKIWPENTDPQKYVYEDVAIATYILLLWEKEREDKRHERKQSFVDLGCGNGFLVHILNSEGYPGKGIDLRSRHIWSLYGPGTNLEECSIIPSDKHLFPDADWLIGNHSDELTPWIPIMATRSSPNTQYFVLPCCFHDFAGKFSRSNSKQSQYRAYLDFVREVGEVSGFDVDEDIMRIPSTKRICQVGRRSTNVSCQEQAALDETIQKYITNRCPHKLLTKPITNLSHNSLSSKMKPASSSTEGANLQNSSSSTSTLGEDTSPDTDVQIVINSDQERLFEGTTTNGANVERTKDDANKSASGDSHEQWAHGFQPRSKVEAVRNCSRLNWDIKEKIVNDIAFALLRLGGVSLEKEDDGEAKVKGQKLWRRGGKMTIPEVVGLFDSDVMKQMKSECGGLKTLLKNANQVFEVSGSTVQLKDWSAPTMGTEKRSAAKRNKGNRDRKPIKSKQCWFYSHHPDGCPRLPSDCSFAHGLDDLQQYVPDHKATQNLL